MDSSGLAKRRKLWLSACSSKKRGLVSSASCSSKGGLGFCDCIFKGLRACDASTCNQKRCSTSTEVDLKKRKYTIAPLPLSSPLCDLTDDLLLEIFLRVPAKSLHLSKSVSKRCSSLISHPPFARSYILARLSNDDHQDINNILFFKIGTNVRSRIGRVFGLPILHGDINKVSSSMSGSLPPLSFDFIPHLRPDQYDYHDGLSPMGVTERLLVDMDLKGDCTDLLLLRAVFQDRTDATPYFDNLPYYIYYVCNPVIKQWVQLPSISTLDFVGFTCYYLQQGEEGEKGEKMTRIWSNNTASFSNITKQGAKYDPNKIEFTVVSINRDEEEDVFVIRVFSSTDKTAEWRIFRVPFPRGYKWRNTLERHKVLFSSGKFHWIGGTFIAAYDPFNKPHQCDIIPLPLMDPSVLAGTHVFETYDGCIRVGTPLYTGRCSVWELADYANKLWVKKYEVNVDFQDYVGIQSFVGGAAGDKAYVVTNTPSNTIMVFDLKDASLQHVYTYPSIWDGNSDNGYYESDFHLSYSKSYVSSPWPTRLPLLQQE